MEVLRNQYITCFLSTPVALGSLDPIGKPEVLRSYYHVRSAKLVFPKKTSPLIKNTFKRRV